MKKFIGTVTVAASLLGVLPAAAADLLSSHAPGQGYCGSWIPTNEPIVAGPATDIITPPQRQTPGAGFFFDNEFAVKIDCSVDPEALALEYGATLTFHYPHLDNINTWRKEGVADPEAYALILIEDPRILDAYPVYQAQLSTGWPVEQPIFLEEPIEVVEIDQVPLQKERKEKKNDKKDKIVQIIRKLMEVVKVKGKAAKSAPAVLTTCPLLACLATPPGCIATPAIDENGCPACATVSCPVTILGSPGM